MYIFKNRSGFSNKIQTDDSIKLYPLYQTPEQTQTHYSVLLTAP